MKVVFGQQLVAVRKAHKLSQEALGAAVGVTKSTVSKWEGGSAEPSLAHLAALKSELKVGLDQLIVGAVNPVALRQHKAMMEGAPLPYLIKEYEAELRVETMLDLFQSLDAQQQQAAIDVLKAMKPRPPVAAQLASPPRNAAKKVAKSLR